MRPSPPVGPPSETGGARTGGTTHSCRPPSRGPTRCWPTSSTEPRHPRPTCPSSPSSAAAHQHGIAVIHQDLGLVERMTVVENLGITSGYGTRAFMPIANRRERARCRELLAGMGLDVPLDVLVANLSPAVRAGIAIARATRLLQDHAERFIFILDQPTAYLSSEASERVMSLMRAVARSGSAVVFISHRLSEVLSVADRITVLRDGQVADTFTPRQGDHRRIIAAMLGRALEQY